MRAAQYIQTGGPEVIRVVEVPEPHPGPGRIRVAVRAAAVNPIDGKYRSGMMPTKLPKIPGTDVAGVVDELGDGVSGVAIGDEVFGNAIGGSMAEFAVLNEWAAKPAELSWAEAAGIPLAAETATRAMDAIGVDGNATVVINGASGGVGSAAVQLAASRGARVIGVASPKQADYLRELGAEPVAYGPGLVERITSVAGDGVTHAFDVAGSGVIPELIELTGSPDKVISIADWSGHGAKVSSGAEGRSWNALADVAKLLEKGRYRVEVQQTFPLDQTGAALALVDGGHVRGKVIVEP